MSGRLLAWGGTAYVWRNRLGDWPAFPSSDLEDLASLPRGAGAVSHGVGFAGDRPFVIFRERQTEEDRGGYAYTLLLDPGEAAWRAASWNGARLCRILLDSQFGQTLRRQPESIRNVDQLDAHLAELIWEETTPAFDGLPDELTLHLAGSSFEKEAVVLRQPSEVPSKRASWREVEAMLDLVPPCVRCGRGWLIGARLGNALAFGCQFALDDRPATDASEVLTPPPREGYELASRLTSSWRQLRLSGDMPAGVTDWFDRPHWTWDGDASRTAQHLVALVDLVPVATPPVAEQAAAAVEEESPLSDLIVQRLAAWSAVAPLVPERTTRLLVRERVHDIWRPVAAEGVVRLDGRFHSGALVDEFHATGLRPDSPNVAHVALDPEVVCLWWERVLETARPDALPGLVSAVGAHLRSLKPGPADSKARRVKLASLALARFRTAALPLTGWSSVGSEPDWRDVLPGLLREEVRRTVAPRGSAWVCDYALYGQDDDLEWLHANHPSALVPFLDGLQAALHHGDAPLRLRAQSLLGRLANLKIREVLPIDLKLRVAAARGGAWAPLSTVEGLWRGKPWPRSKASVPPAQVGVLVKELTVLAAETRHPDTPPRLAELRDLLGVDLPADVVRRAVDLAGHTEAAGSAAIWIDALSPIVPPDTVRQLAWTVWQRTYDFDSGLLKWLTPEDLLSAFPDVLCRNDRAPQDAAATLTGLVSALMSGPTPRVAELATETLAALRSSRRERAAETLLSSSELLDVILPAFAERAQLSFAELLADALRERFDELVSQWFLRLAELERRGGDLYREPGSVLILVTLLTPKLRARGEAIAAAALGPDSWEFAATISRFVNRASIDLSPALRRALTDAQQERRRGWIQRILRVGSTDQRTRSD